MKAYLLLVSFLLACALLYFLSIFPLPPRAGEEDAQWDHVTRVALSGGLVALFGMAMVIGWLRFQRDLPK